MRFSIITPAHNSAQFIEKALTSVREQVFEDYELIVICDSCIDNTFEIAARYGDIVKEVNFGNVGETRNVGLSLASGDYILFLDDDDHFLHKYTLLMLNEYIEKHPTTDILCFGFISGINGYKNALTEKGNAWPNVWSKLWKHSLIKNIRFEKSNHAEDLKFCNAAFNITQNIDLVDEPLVFYNSPRVDSLTYKFSKGLL